MESVELFRDGLWVILKLSAPGLIVATIIGIVISLLQSLFQIQDQTLSNGLKIVAITFVLLMTGRWMQIELLNLADAAFVLIGQVR